MANNSDTRSKAIGVRIAECRKDKGLTQKQLADRINVNRMTIARYEQGVSSPKDTTLEKIADALEVPRFWLLFDEQTAQAILDHANNQANEIVNRLNSTIQRLNTKGINKVIEYAELLATQAEYISIDE